MDPRCATYTFNLQETDQQEQTQRNQQIFDALINSLVSGGYSRGTHIPITDESCDAIVVRDLLWLSSTLVSPSASTTSDMNIRVLDVLCYFDIHEVFTRKVVDASLLHEQQLMACVHYAVLGGAVNVVRYLLSMEADDEDDSDHPHKRSRYNRHVRVAALRSTPIARALGRFDIASMLRQAGTSRCRITFNRPNDDETLREQTADIVLRSFPAKRVLALLRRRLPVKLQRCVIDRVPLYDTELIGVLYFGTGLLDSSRLHASIWCSEARARLLRDIDNEDSNTDLVVGFGECYARLFKHHNIGNSTAPATVLNPMWDTTSQPRVVLPADEWLSACLCVCQAAPCAALPGSTPLTVSREEFMLNMEAMTGLEYAALSRVLSEQHAVISGGAVVQCLLPSLPPHATLEERRTYYDEHCVNSDVDIFPVVASGGTEGDDDQHLLQRITALVDTFAGTGSALVLADASTLHVLRPFPQRRVQIHRSQWHSIGDLLLFSDVDCAAVAFDGAEVRFSHRALFSWAYRVNIANPESMWPIRGSPTYERRLYTYAQRGFRVLDTDATEGATEVAAAPLRLSQLHGLSWLRLAEARPELVRPRRGQYPWRRGITFPSIAEHVRSGLYTPCDNYGHGDAGMVVCCGWVTGTSDRQKILHGDDDEDNESSSSLLADTTVYDSADEGATMGSTYLHGATWEYECTLLPEKADMVDFMRQNVRPEGLLARESEQERFELPGGWYD